LEKKFGAQIVNDGITVAKGELEDPGKHRRSTNSRSGVKTKDVAGDGTTATVLAQAMIREGLKNVAAGANPVSLRRGLKNYRQFVEEIAAVAKPVEGSAIAVATVSAGNDEEVGTMIAEAMESHQRRCDYR